jgi:molybdate-binding protein
VVLGSHDPLLDWALRESRCGLATFFDGSDDGLDRFAADEGIVTGLHLFDVATDTWNVAAVAAQFANDNIVLIEWAKRQRGLIVADHVTQKPRTVADVRGLTIAIRQSEAGAQKLFLSLLAQAGLSERDVTFTDPARTEADAVQLVSEGRADVTLGLSALAKVHKLPFVPILTERFDLMVDRKAWFDPPMQAFMTFCHSDRFRARALDWHGYDVSGLGGIMFNA